MSSTSHTEREILSQPDVWRETLTGLDVVDLRQGFGASPVDVVVTGCGSTHYLSLTVACPPARCGAARSGVAGVGAPGRRPAVPARPRAHGAAGVLPLGHHHRDAPCRRQLPPARRCHRRRGHLLPRLSPGARCRRRPHHRGRGGAQCRPDPLVLLDAAGRPGRRGSRRRPRPRATGRPPSPRGSAALRGPPVDGGPWPGTARWTRFYFLASGPLLGVASEGMLKLKEMSLTSSEAYHAMEFRHGPMSMCDSGRSCSDWCRRGACSRDRRPRRRAAHGRPRRDDRRPARPPRAGLAPDRGHHRCCTCCRCSCSLSNGRWPRASTRTARAT